MDEDVVESAAEVEMESALKVDSADSVILSKSGDDSGSDMAKSRNTIDSTMRSRVDAVKWFKQINNFGEWMAPSSHKKSILEHTLLWVGQITITLADRQDHLDEWHDDVDVRLVLVQGTDSLDDVGKYLQQLTFAGQRVDNGPNTAKR